MTWMKRRDKHQNSDNVSGMGDQIEDFSEQGNVDLTGNPISVKFIAKDETNFGAMKKMGMNKLAKKWYW
jgi:hypothetical protein